MKSIDKFNSIFLWREFVDFRKSINGLAAMVQEEMKLDPFNYSLFIFCCRRKKRIKILYWDKTGFALWYKRLEKDIFPWPEDLHDEIIQVTSKQLEWVLDGINIWKIRPHEEKKYSKTC